MLQPDDEATKLNCTEKQGSCLNWCHKDRHIQSWFPLFSTDGLWMHFLNWLVLVGVIHGNPYCQLFTIACSILTEGSGIIPKVKIYFFLWSCYTTPIVQSKTILIFSLTRLLKSVIITSNLYIIPVFVMLKIVIIGFYLPLLCLPLSRAPLFSPSSSSLLLSSLSSLGSLIVLDLLYLFIQSLEWAFSF